MVPLLKGNQVSLHPESRNTKKRPVGNKGDNSNHAKKPKNSAMVDNNPSPQNTKPTMLAEKEPSMEKKELNHKRQRRLAYHHKKKYQNSEQSPRVTNVQLAEQTTAVDNAMLLQQDLHMLQYFLWSMPCLSTVSR
ncbi:hypothetical protein QOT17_021100 [Balamuthia mandrillaris]